MTETVIQLILLSLATWRLASLFATEDGPLDAFFELRVAAGAKVRWVDGMAETYVPSWEEIEDKSSPAAVQYSFLKGLCCVWCESVWWGVLLSVLYVLWPGVAVGISLPFAVSAAAIWFDRRVR